MFALCYFHAALLERKKFGVGNLPGATSGALCCVCAEGCLPGALGACAWACKHARR